MHPPFLYTLLDESLSLGPEYGAGLSTHLPMALHALHAMGAGPSRLRTFSLGYRARFGAPEKASAAAAPLPGDWGDARGDFGAFSALRQHIEVLLRDQGPDATLHALLPALWPGSAGAAFHGLIRTAHAVQSGHTGELAAALAYWAARWQAAPVPAVSRLPVASLPVTEWAAQLEAAALELRLPGRLISLRIGVAVQTPAYAALADATSLDSLSPLSDWAADLYARSGNFTVLHVVTATRAARVLWPWTTARSAVLQDLLHAVTAAVLASHLQRAAPLGADDALPTWPELVDRAVASDDEHEIKLVHALVEECEVYGEGRRRQAAVRVLLS